VLDPCFTTESVRTASLRVGQTSLLPESGEAKKSGEAALVQKLHTHTAAVVTPTGRLIDHVTVPTDHLGAKRMLAFAHGRAPGRRVWAIEGTGAYGTGLTSALLEQGEWVVEIDRPRRPVRRSGAKSDELDALHALVVSAPEGLRRRLRHLGTRELTARCARLRAGTGGSSEQRATILALRSTARRALACEAEAAELESALRALVESARPDLLAEPGVGPICAARILNAWSPAGRIRSEAAFAMLAGVAPVEASSGRTVRHRLNRSGDRQLNRALHTIVLVRLAHDAETRAYARRRTEEGKTPREIKRCLKRHLARRVFRLLENPTQAT
jgi:transposase